MIIIIDLIIVTNFFKNYYRKLIGHKTDINVYPWSKEQEPQDIYRNIEEIQKIDVEYYNYFMTTNSLENNVASVRKI